MIAILSPAKNMRVAPARPSLAMTVPKRMKEAQEIMEILQKIPPYALETTMKINSKLALKVAADFADWTPQGGTQAILTYKGMAYQNLSPDTMTDEDLTYAQDHLRHISALYGALRPLDAIQTHRLEMAHRPRGWDLYRIWSHKIRDDLYSDTDTIINLASSEYSRAIMPYLKPQDRMITCEFLCDRGGKKRCIAALAKMARGSMARFIVKERIENVYDLTKFEEYDFYFSPELSNDTVYSFLRKE